MKIAYITPDFPYAEDPFLAAEIASLSELGAEIVVVPVRAYSRPAKIEDLAGSQIIVLPALGIKTIALAAVQACAGPRSVTRAARAVLFGQYGAKAKRQNAVIFAKSIAVARLLRREGVHHIHAHHSSAPSTMAYVASILTGIPWSCTAQWVDVAENNMLASKVASAAFIRATSPRAHAAVIHLSGGAIDGRCSVVPPAIRTQGRVRPTGASQALRIACLSRLSTAPLKVVLTALSALRDEVPFECDIVADGPPRPALTALVDRYDLRAQVHVRPWISHERLFAQLCNGEYGMAIVAENTPQLLAEAMLAGVACIVTWDAGDLLEEDCAILVRPNPVEIAGAVRELYADRDKRMALGQRALSRARAVFDARANTGRLLQLINGGA